MRPHPCLQRLWFSPPAPRPPLRTARAATSRHSPAPAPATDLWWRPRFPRRGGPVRHGPVEPRHALHRTGTRGGYDYRDGHIKGFSLTHLSGAGCALYGDFPFLPTHRADHRLPGAPRRPRPRRPFPARLHPRPRAGLAGLLRGSAQPRPAGADPCRADRDDAHRDGPLHLPAQPSRQRARQRRRQRPADDFAAVQIVPAGARSRQSPPAATSAPSDPATGSTSTPASTGPSTRFGTWGRQALHRRGKAASRRASAPRPLPRRPAPRPGPTSTFDTRRNRVVNARVGVSFVSVEGARANLAAENRGL